MILVTKLKPIVVKNKQYMAHIGQNLIIIYCEVIQKREI
jgi:hypothetical protein